MARRKDGYLEKTVTIDGRRIHVYGRTQKEIKEKIEELYRQDFEGTLGINQETKFKDYADHWYEIHTAEKSKSTQMSYAQAISHLKNDIGDERIGDIKRSEIEKMLNKHSDTPVMRNKILSVCKMIFYMACDDELIKYNPAANIKKQKAEKKIIRDNFTDKEKEMILNAELSEKDRLIVDLLYYTGIRRGELLGLNSASVDNGFLKVRQQNQFGETGIGYITTPKTQTSLRDIPVPEWLENEFKKYAKAHNSFYVFDEIRNKNPFYAEWDSILTAFIKYHDKDFKEPSRHLPLRANYPCDITPHHFRHNYASMLYENNVDVKVAQKLLGHSSIATTLGIYTHLSEKGEKEVSEAVRGLFENRNAM